MSQKMPDSKIEWVSVDQCRAMEQQLNSADSRIAISDLNMSDHRVLDENKSFIFELDLE